jgi:tripartite ATP-independent transporter DctM subunit
MPAPEIIGLIGIVVMVVLLALRMPIGIAMLLVGVVGFAVLNGVQPALSVLGSYPYSYSAVYELAVIPLFVLMGNAAAASGMSRDLYAAAYAWVGHWRGGLASATVLACAGFAAVSGSSVASAVTMGKVCLPEMRRYKYDPRLATGTVAAGGTLGILIPPSISMVVYGAITGESIGRLFIAGVVPGLLLAAVFALYAFLRSLRSDVRVEPRASWGERGHATIAALGPMLLPPIILGGIYLGVFTPTESAGIGVLVALILGLVVYRKIGVGDLPPLVEKTARTAGMILMIIAAATVFSHLVTLMRVPQSIAAYVAEAGVTKLQFWAVIVALCIVLGCFLEAAAILYLVVPVVSPVLPVLGIEHAQFAVVLVILIELGMITPPLGLNLFVIQGLQPKATLTDVSAGSLPFMLLMLAGAAVVIAWPQLSLALPNYLGS